MTTKADNVLMRVSNNAIDGISVEKTEAEAKQQLAEELIKDLNNYPLANTVDKDNQAWLVGDVEAAIRRYFK